MPRSSPGQRRGGPFGALRDVATGVAQVGNQNTQYDMSGWRAVGAKEWPVWVRRKLYGEVAIQIVM